MKRANGGSLLGRVGRKSEMRRTSNAGARSVDIWPASALEFSFGTLLVILLAALKIPLSSSHKEHPEPFPTVASYTRKRVR